MYGPVTTHYSAGAKDEGGLVKGGGILPPGISYCGAQDSCPGSFCSASQRLHGDGLLRPLLAQPGCLPSLLERERGCKLQSSCGCALGIHRTVSVVNTLPLATRPGLPPGDTRRKPQDVWSRGTMGTMAEGGAPWARGRNLRQQKWGRVAGVAMKVAVDRKPLLSSACHQPCMMRDQTMQPSLPSRFFLLL